jgi:hypothetical protein
MIQSFHPPSVAKLWEIDQAKVTYCESPVEIEGLVSVNFKEVFQRRGTITDCIPLYSPHGGG